MTDNKRNGLGTRVAIVGSVVALVGSLVGVGMRVGSLTTMVEIQNSEINRLRASVDGIDDNVQSLELYVRDLHMAR